MPLNPHVIGIYGSARHEVVSRRFSGVIRYCAEHKIQVRDFRRVNDYEVVLEKSTPQPWKLQVDGLILCIGREVHLSDQELADWIVGGGVPAVSTAADWADSRIPQVYCNHRSLAKLAAKHLSAAGSKSFLFVGSNRSNASADRSQEFQQALKAMGKNATLHLGQNRYLATFEDEELALKDRTLVEYLQKLPEPIGVWGANDPTANAVSLLCKRLKLEVPQQVKILGVDDTTMARMQLPMLSSIHTPAEEIGYRAASKLMQMLAGKKVPEFIDVPQANLVVRESTVEAPRGRGNIDDVLEYIERHACEGISIDELPKIVGISRRSLHDLFLAHVGHTPVQEVQRVRLERAKKLLRETQISISRIASMVGFEESTAFGKFFRSQTEMTPREYRDKK